MLPIDAEKISNLDVPTIEKLAKAQSSVQRKGGAVFHAARNRAILLYRQGLDWDILTAFGQVSLEAQDANTALSAINLAYITTIYPEQFTIQEKDALTVAWRSVMGEDGFL